LGIFLLGSVVGALVFNVYQESQASSDEKIVEAEKVVLSGNATENDVLLGKEFYSNSETKLIGKAAPEIDYSLQQFNEFDDYYGPNGSKDLAEDYQLDEGNWVNTATNVYQDSRTKLFWSSSQGNFTNVFPNKDHTKCGYFSAKLKGDYNGTDLLCGNAINYCANLALDADNDGIKDSMWYLPTQKELAQAYQDGIANKTAKDFATTGMVWTSTELSFKPETAWGGSLATGGMYAFDNLKTKAFLVHCVMRK